MLYQAWLTYGHSFLWDFGTSSGVSHLLTAFIWVSFGGFVIGDPLHGLGARPTHTEHAEPQRAVHLAELSRRLAGSRFAAFSRASQPCRTGFHPVVVVLDCSVKLRFDSFKKEENVNLEIFTEGVPYSFCSLVVLKWWVLVEFVSVSLWGTLSSSSVVWEKGAEALPLWQPLKAGWFSRPSAEVFQLFTEDGCHVLRTDCVVSLSWWAALLHVVLLQGWVGPGPVVPPVRATDFRVHQHLSWQWSTLVCLCVDSTPHRIKGFQVCSAVFLFRHLTWWLFWWMKSPDSWRLWTVFIVPGTIDTMCVMAQGETCSVMEGNVVLSSFLNANTFKNAFSKLNSEFFHVLD